MSDNSLKCPKKIQPFRTLILSYSLFHGSESLTLSPRWSLWKGSTVLTTNPYSYNLIVESQLTLFLALYLIPFASTFSKIKTIH